MITKLSRIAYTFLGLVMLAVVVMHVLNGMAVTPGVVFAGLVCLFCARRLHKTEQ